MIALLTATAALRLDELRFELSAEGMMVEVDPARDFYHHTLDTFGIEGLLPRRLPPGGFLAVFLLRPHDQQSFSILRGKLAVREATDG